MADSPRAKREKSPEAVEKQSDVQALWKHMRENPLVYLGCTVFLAVVVLIYTFYWMSRDLSEREVASAYARALSLDDTGERAAALKPIAQKKTRLAARALYLHGESALGASDYAAAAAAFTRLRETYPDFEFVPDAVEGLGFIEEDQGEHEAALTIYGEVLAKWPDSAAGRRQPLNIARCLEQTGEMGEAVRSYREQLEVFPGSLAALEAQRRLSELRTTHPELFEDETADGGTRILDLTPGDELGGSDATAAGALVE